MVTKTTLGQRVGARARAIREARGITQREVAAQAGMAHQEVSRFESKTANPHLNTVERVARALGVRVEDLVKEES